MPVASRWWQATSAERFRQGAGIGCAVERILVVGVTGVANTEVVELVERAAAAHLR